MRTSTLFALCTGLFTGLLLVGCGGSSPSAACRPVTVTVKYKGQAVEGAQVTFIASGADQRNAAGTTDASGVCNLSTFGDDDGAMPGKYIVTVAKTVTDSNISAMNDPSLITQDPGAGSGATGAPAAAYLSQVTSTGEMKEGESSLPAHYSDSKTSGLSFTVADSANNFTITVKDKK